MKSGDSIPRFDSTLIASEPVGADQGPADAGSLKTIGKYDVLRKIGAGAMGVVYECLHPELNRRVAVKVLLTSLHSTPEQVRRFEREARSAARLSHPIIAHVFDVGVDNGHHYIVMEYVDGVSLECLIGTSYLSVVTTLRLLYHIAQALSAAHANEIVHRDLKPSNILIDRSGRPRIVDFGLAKSVTEDRSLSGRGDLIGSPRYMSPEQVLAACDEIDGRSDIFALGAIMYEMLAGKPAFNGPNVLSILRQVVDDSPQPLTDHVPLIPPDVIRICQRALEKDKSQRYSTVLEMASDIRAALVALSPDEAVEQEELLATFVPPQVVPATPAKRPVNLWLFMGAGISLAAIFITISVWSNSRQSDPTNNSADKTTNVRSSDGKLKTDFGALRDDLVRDASKMLSGPLTLSSPSPPRDALKSIIDDLSLLLKQTPQDKEIRRLRAAAYRRSGEYLAAEEDLSILLRNNSKDTKSVTERLLARYQLYGLYLGNFNEPHLRPTLVQPLLADCGLLKTQGDSSQRYVAALVSALVQQQFDSAEQLVQDRPPETTSSVAATDLAMLEADLLYRTASYWSGVTAEDPDQPTPSQRIGARANRVLRGGLDLDPHHVGLLFLKANSIQTRTAWEDIDGEGRNVLLRRNRMHFDSAFDGLRLSTLRVGCDTWICRAILMANRGLDSQALDQIQEGLSCRPTLAHLYCVKAWLRLRLPEEGVLDAESLRRIQRELEPVFESTPEDFLPYFVRGTTHLVSAQWDDARRDMKESARALKQNACPNLPEHYSICIQSAAGPMTVFLDQAKNILNEFSVPQEVRISLLMTIIQRTENQSLTDAEGLDGEQVHRIGAWAHVALAEVYAALEDRTQVLEQIDKALALKQADVNAQFFREHGIFSAWNDDPEFTAIYQRHELSSNASSQ